MNDGLLRDYFFVVFKEHNEGVDACAAFTLHNLPENFMVAKINAMSFRDRVYKGWELWIVEDEEPVMISKGGAHA